MSRGTSDTGALFDAAATSWAARYQTRPSLIARYKVVGTAVRDELASRARDQEETIKALDFGSGPGVFAAAISDLSARVLCVDRSEEMLQASAHDEKVLQSLTRQLGAVYRPERIERILGDETILNDLPSDSFQIILAIAVLEYLPGPQQTIAELLRCLVPDGTLFFTLPNRASVIRRIEPPLNAVASWLGSRFGSARLSERACTGQLGHLRGLDVPLAVGQAGGVIRATIPIPLSPDGLLRRVEPNYLYKATRRAAPGT